jgi:hypothetical protein
MAELAEKKDVKTPVAPDKQRLDLRPRLKRPPAPRIYRWIQWMAVLAVLALGAVMAVVLLSDDGEVTAAYDRGAEHGDHTPLVVRDLSGVDLSSRYAGLDANFDPNPVPEHGSFTPMVFRNLTGVTIERMAGLDANLDPDVVLSALDADLGDVVLGAGYHTAMPATWGDVTIAPRYAGLDTSPEGMAQPADALDRYVANN